ncbi:MAG: aminotransferase class III-fold pyridoxal phosphate-dependent enzyme [Saprospiraceae bacterium]|nr:aminotransferase class III-fold pyridoxal phosphate-dependent enzyme [Saprospiraceae bacterium]
MKHNIQPLLGYSYLKAVSAEGVYITDENGKRYLDGSSGAITCSIGHSHPRMIARLKDQLDRLQFVYRSQFGSVEAESLAEKLCLISPDKKYSRSFFVNSGSEATETAMKVAWQYWQEQGQPDKVKFIARRKSYHGITLGSLALSGHKLRRQRFEHTLLQFPVLQSDMEDDTLDEQIEEIEQIIDHEGSHTIAGIVLEPIVGAAGSAIMPPPGYYQLVRELCDRRDILFIADEVLTGMGRTGEYFALNHWDTVADIVAIGKSLGAGYAPIAATLMQGHILEPIKRGSGLIMSGHTYSGHPFSCAAALEVLEIIEEENLPAKATELGSILMEELIEFQRKYDFINKVRGKGMLLGCELDPDVGGIQSRLVALAFEEGLLIYPSVGGRDGSKQNGFLVAPPLTISESEIDELIGKLGTALSKLQNQIVINGQL